jgi:hypothetical protein
VAGVGRHSGVVRQQASARTRTRTGCQLAPCSLGLSATGQQYFSLRTNQPPTTSQQYSSLRTNQPSATSQPNRLWNYRTLQKVKYVPHIVFIKKNNTPTKLHKILQSAELQKSPPLLIKNVKRPHNTTIKPNMITDDRNLK